MAPRPKTYGARRSYAKPVGKLVDGTIADDSGYETRNNDAVFLRKKNSKEKGRELLPKGEGQKILSQDLEIETKPASGLPMGQCASQERTLEEKSTPVSPVPWSLRTRRMSAQDILAQDTAKEQGSCRKRIRISHDESAMSQNQNLIDNEGSQSMPVDNTSPLYTTTTIRPNGFIKEYQPSHPGCYIDLKDQPSKLHELGVWVAHLIKNYHQDKNASSVILQRRQEDFRPEPGQDTSMSDAVDNVEDVRMTRGKEKKRLQQLKLKELAIDSDLSHELITREGNSSRLKDGAPIGRLLKDQLDEKFKQKLFGVSDTTEVSADVIERNACGTLLFDTIVDVGDSTDCSSAAALRAALQERKDNAPFISALNILASSSKVVAFVNFILNKEVASQWEASVADESRLSRPSTGAETSGATTITESSELTSRARTSTSNTEASIESMNRPEAMDYRTTDKQKRSQAVTQALEAATAILVQIEQGEAGAAYLTTYAGGSMFPSPVGQHHLIGYATAHGPPHHNAPAQGMMYGYPVGSSLNTYASPYVTPLAPQPESYSSPYSNPGNQPSINYASPYANPMISNQGRETGFVGSSNNQPSNHGGLETHHDNRGAQMSSPTVNATEAEIRNHKAVSKYTSNETGEIRISCKEANRGVGTQKEERESYNEATGQGITNVKKKVGNIVELVKTDVDGLKKHDNSNEEDEISGTGDTTDDDLPVVRPVDKNITPPAEDHRLFTGERLGDFSSVENIDWLLTMSNGGKIPTPRKKRATRSPSISPPSQADDQIQKIIDEILIYKDRRGHPHTTTTKQLFYASAEAQQLAAELRRLMAIAKPVVNTIIPVAESKARLMFYQKLESRANKEKRDCEAQEGMNRLYGAPIQIQQWIPPTIGPHPVPFPMPQPLPSNVPMEVPFIRRGNVIAAPPGGRNSEEEQKAETYGYPPVPGSRPGESQQGPKRKRTGQH